MVSLIQHEKRLLWHPRQDNKFAVGGSSQITLYEWAQDYPEIRQVTSQHDLQLMKCFAWSPDQAFDDLVAVGMSTGRVDLIRLEAPKHARANNILSSGPKLTLPVRNSRSCNALAFCTTDPNYLAVGLDKVRGDCSLIIWDINTMYPSLSISLPSTGGLPFVPRPQPQIPRGDLPPRTDPKILQQHAPTEIVSSLAFLPQSTNLLLAGISHRWLRLFDLRSSVPLTTNVPSKVHGITTDPFDPNRIGCFGDGVVTIWDVRKLLHPLLTFSEKDAIADGARIRPNSTYGTIEFSNTRRGTLATLEKDAGYVRFWDLMHAQAHAMDGSSDGRDSSAMSNRTTRMSWANLPWTAGSNAHQQTPREPEMPSLVLYNTRRTKNFSPSLSSFALVPNSQAHPLITNIMVVNKEGDLELNSIYDTLKHTSWSARGDLALSAGQSCKVIRGFEETEPPQEPWDILTKQSDEHNNSAPTQQSVRPPRDESTVRGRVSGKPDFGRGDEDGFPALTSAAPTNLAATRPDGPRRTKTKTRTYSPASLRNYSHRFETRTGSRSRSRQPDREGTLSKGHSRLESIDKTPGKVTRKQNTVKTVNRIVEEDISMIIRRRVVLGYGIGHPEHNVSILQGEPSDQSNHMLSELWSWINHSKQLLCIPTPRLLGYDFSYEGLLGIWDGIRPLHISQDDTLPPISHRDHLDPHDMMNAHLEDLGLRRAHSPADDINGHFYEALQALASQTGMDKSTWKPPVPTTKLLERQIALQLCGWSLRDVDLINMTKKWEKDGKYSRAACWLVFTRQYGSAVELLMRSEEESDHMMSGTLAALIPHGSGSSSKNIELRDHCERLIVRLQDPYFRAMLTHLTLGDWSEVLEEEALPFRERLAIAFQFLDDTTLTSYLRRTTERSAARGDIDGIIVTGLTKSGMDILQSYVDRTGDVQTATILSTYVCPSKFADSRPGRWLDAYRDLLDGFKLYHHRVNLDIERGQIIQEAVQNSDLPPQYEWAPRQVLIRCHYCSKAINLPQFAAVQTRTTACPNCNRSLPRCSICLMTLGIVQDAPREAELAYSKYKDTIDDAIVICQTCRHGGHASHLLDWFFGEDNVRSHGTCPVADCDCRCADEF